MPIREKFLRTIADVLKDLRPGDDEDTVFERDAAEAHIRELAALAEKPAERPADVECPDCDKLIAERDEMEERVNRICEALELTEEESTWSNLNDPAERCIEKAEALLTERPQLSAEQVPAEARRKVVDAALWCKCANEVVVPLRIIREVYILGNFELGLAEKVPSTGGWDCFEQRDRPAAPPVLQAEPKAKDVIEPPHHWAIWFSALALSPKSDLRSLTEEVELRDAAIRREAERAAFEKAAHLCERELTDDERDDWLSSSLPLEDWLAKAIRALADSPVSGEKESLKRTKGSD